MQVILLERVEKLGFMGDVVEVKPGFARNYLLPQKKALRANKDNLLVFEAQKAHLEADNLKHKQDAQAAAKKIEGVNLSIIRQAGDSGQLYGSVTPKDIADQMTADGYKVQKSQVEISTPIKNLGLHEVNVRLHPEVKVGIIVNVAKSAEEALNQLRGDDVKAKEAEEAFFESSNRPKKMKAEEENEEEIEIEITETNED